jgi:hypothetical protein
MKEPLTGPFRIFAACAAGPDKICLGLVPKTMERGYPFTRLARFRAGEWETKDVPFAVSGIATAFFPTKLTSSYQILAETGETFPFDDAALVERIAELAASATAYEPRIGFLNAISQIEGDLLVVGDRAQVYRRKASVWNRLGSEIDQEINEDDEDDDILKLLRSPSLLSDRRHMRDHRKKFRDGTPITLWCISGKTSNDFYVGGGRGNVERTLLHWDGSNFNSVIESPTDPEDYTASLTDILVETADRVWACGHRGALLVGNSRDGFRQDPAADVDTLFQSMTLFEDHLYLASVNDIYRHDGDRLSRIRPGVKRLDAGAFYIRATEDVLWAVSPNDVLRYDGTNWERIPYPGSD